MAVDVFWCSFNLWFALSPAISLHLTMWYILFSIWSFFYLLLNLYPELSVLHSLQYWKECKDRQLWVEIASYYPFLHSFPVVVNSLLPDCPIPWGRIMVFNATFNNNPAISWRSVLLVEEIRRKPPICCKSLTNFQLGNAHHQPRRWVQWMSDAHHYLDGELSDTHHHYDGELSYSA